MQWKRSTIGRFFFFGLVVGLAGCRPTPSVLDIPASPYRGDNLAIVCPSAAMAKLMRGQARPWALRQGVTLAVHEYDPSNPKDERGGKVLAAADIWIIPSADLPSLAAAGRVAAVPAVYMARDNAYAWSDLLPIFREQLMAWDGKPYGLPIVGESPLCCYRTDLLQAPEHQAALTKLLGPSRDGPTTWEQFAQLAEYFQERGVAGRAGPGLPPLPVADTDLDRLFYTVAAGFARRAVRVNEERGAGHQDDVFSFHYDLKTGQPRIAAPGFVHALRLLQRLRKCRSSDGGDHPEEAFRAGRAVLCLTDAPWLKTFQQMPALRDKVGFCRMPGGECYYDFVSGKAVPTPQGNRVPYLGGAGWLAVVSSQSHHPEAAFDLLADLSGAKTSTQIFLGAIDRGGPLRASQLYRNRWDTFDLDIKRTPHLPEVLQETLLHPNLKNPALCLRTPRQAAHRALLLAGLRKALSKGGADAEETLRSVAEGWRKLDRAQGLEEHKADYRRSLGLLAK